MIKKSRGISFLSSLPKNIFSGFVVSLVALPLGLGLAIASEAPPIAGVIASIVGGVICSIFGGSNLTITGPGNGLVIVLLYSITSLGNGDLYQGYLYTLAAIVFSGVLMFLFGVFRLGALSEFFPSSSLQGMLAAIGIGILAKQLHVMLGVTTVNGAPLNVLSKVPDTLSFLFSNLTLYFWIPVFLGLFSLVVLIFYSRLRSPLFRMVPAPMWVIVFAVGVSFYLEFFTDGLYNISESLMIRLPKNIVTNIPAPDYSLIGSLEFITTVISITLIASIESLLSIKAVDKLDPQKRRSNVNKDLRSLGVATTLSGLIGGLPVVTVIARSSVNVNNGGSNRTSNFTHAMFLLVFVLIFQDLIERIALPSLAAILVYTGYKLAAPDNFIRILKIGKEQAAIFIITFVITLTNGIVVGIATGILFTFLIHVYLNNSFFLFSRNWLKPNVLMYLEAETGNYYLSVKNFCNFLNFFKLKKKLDEIPETSNVIIDFSLCDFVDHTVMEGLSEYISVFEKKGGRIEVIGLDSHSANTQHPFAIRKNLPSFDFFKFQNNLTKRQISLKNFAKNQFWSYFPDPSLETKLLESFKYFKTKTINYQYNELAKDSEGFSIFDLSYSEGAFIAKDNLLSTFLLIKTEHAIPVFIIEKDFIFSGLGDQTSYDEVNFEMYPDFSNRFFLSGVDSVELKNLFDAELVFFFESHAYFRIESSEGKILIKGKSRLLSLQEIKSLISFAKELMLLLNKKYGPKE
ncbi:MAG: SulP family inorganic anion transporter [Candidatus Marivariicella sp.]